MLIVSEQTLWWERYKLAGAGASEIASSVEAAVTAGLLKPGEALPPVRDLAGRLGINPNTVAAAYRALRDRGTVETRGRAGTRVRERPGRSERQRSYALPEGVRDLTSGEPEPELLPRLSPPTRIDVSHYRYGASIESALEEQLRLRLARGSLDGIDRLLATHTKPGDKVAIEDPAWGNLLDLLASRGLTAQPMRVDDEGPDSADLRVALVAGVRAVIVTTRAQNPYGAVVSARRAAMLRAELAAYPEVLAIDDDHGADLTPGVPHVLSGATRHWAYLYSASKGYGPDLRIAVLVGDEDSTDRVAGQLRHTARRVPGVMQEVWATALADENHDAVLATAAQTYMENRATLISELSLRGVAAHGETGLNVWIPVPDETAAATGLLARGWAVAPGSWFRVRSGPGVRVTIAGLRPGEAAELAEAAAAALGRGDAGRTSTMDAVPV